jgi:hypothetical protein
MLANSTLTVEVNKKLTVSAVARKYKYLPARASRNGSSTSISNCKGHKEDATFLIEQKSKTYNRRDSQMVTHSSTSRPVQCLCMAERTGCPVFTDLWSYVLGDCVLIFSRLTTMIQIHAATSSANINLMPVSFRLARNFQQPISHQAVHCGASDIALRHL